MTIPSKKFVIFLILIFFNNILGLQTNITISVDKVSDNQIIPNPSKSQHRGQQKTNNGNYIHNNIDNETHVPFDKNFYDLNLFEEPKKFEAKKKNEGNYFHIHIDNETHVPFDKNFYDLNLFEEPKKFEAKKHNHGNNFHIHIDNETHVTFDKSFYDEDLFEEPKKFEAKKQKEKNSTDNAIDSNLQFIASYNITGKIKALGENDSKFKILQENVENPLRKAFTNNKDNLLKKNEKKLKQCEQPKAFSSTDFNERKLDILESDLAKNYEFEEKQLKLLEKDATTKAKLQAAQDELLKMIVLKQAETLARLMKNRKSQ